jgi:hypothetical protein
MAFKLQAELKRFSPYPSGERKDKDSSPPVRCPVVLCVDEVEEILAF